MLHYIMELGKYGLYFAGVTALQFILFFVFVKYRTGQTFQELLARFSHMFAQALFFATSLLFAIVILVKGFSVITFSVIMLSISSLIIILKLFEFVKENTNIIVISGTVLLLNMFDVYFLLTEAPISTKHFFIFYTVVLYLFLYQYLRKLYSYEGAE